jgi:hypothetical protein
MVNINREHPEYVARKAMWRQYQDLYAGGERLRLNASDYLVRRHKEPNEVYRERLGRVFYENYVGSIIDWYAATLLRREPMMLFEGEDETAKNFYGVLSQDCDLKGTNLSEFFRRQFVQMLVYGRSYTVVDFPRASGPALTRAEEDASGRSRAYLGITGRTRSSTGSRRERRTGVGGGPNSLLRQASATEEVGAGDAVGVLRPRELPDTQGRGAKKVE